MADLSRLLELYDDRFRRRSRGGLWALAGFDFQIRTFLADLVASLVAGGPDLEAAGERFLKSWLEAFSDSTRIDGETLVVVQAKRRLTSASLSSAAEELTHLDRFFEEEADPELRNSVAFEVVGRWVTPEGALSWDGISLPAKTQLKDPVLADRFETLRSSGRLLPPRQVRDPWWRLVATAYPHVDDAVALGREMLDLAVGRRETPDDGERLRVDLLDIFTRRRQARHRTRLPGRLLEPDAMERHEERQVLEIGASPQLERLRVGAYYDRPEALGDVLAALDGFLQEIRDRPRTSEPLPVFWIGGPSGSGKSVQLLQLVETLVVERSAWVLWLGAGTRHLRPLLESWPDLAPSLPHPAFVAIDDLYDPQRRDDFDTTLLRDLTLERPDVPWPILLTCGPPEFLEDLQEASGFEGLRFREWRLPLITRRERYPLARWFEQRTGQKAQRGRAAKQEESLAISLLFEMTYGDFGEGDDLRGFASRFRRRLTETDLLEPLRLPLALNRLYIWPPASWLDAEAGDQLERLRESGDFQVLRLERWSNSEDDTGAYLKLTHPHLSDEIYRAVLPRGAGPKTYAQDLGTAFARSLVDAKDIAVRILRSVINPRRSDRLAVVDRELLRSKMLDAWNQASIADSDPHAVLLWQEWHRWAKDDVEVALGLPRKPSDAFREVLALAFDFRYWGSIWQRLWKESRSAALAELANEWLEHQLVQPATSNAWSFVWQALIRSSPTPEVVDLGIRWVAGREHRADWNFVWRDLLHHRVGLADEQRLALLRQGWRHLETSHSSTRADWAFVWQILLDRVRAIPELETTDVLERGWNWLREKGHSERDEWSHVWRQLLDRVDHLSGAGIEEVLELGWHWLQPTGRSERHDWAFVWRAVLEQVDLARVGPKEVLRLGWSWVQDLEHSERAEWGFLWRSVFDRIELLETVSPAQVLAQAWAWILDPEHAKHPGWSHIWRAILEHVDQAPDLGKLEVLELGWAWAGDPDSVDVEGWTFVWRGILEHSDPQADLDPAPILAFGWEFVQAPERRNRPDWAFVWRLLLERSSELPGAERSEVLGSGWRWLTDESNDQPDAWTHVWQALWKYRQDSDLEELERHLLDRMEVWLLDADNRSLGTWDKLFEVVLDAGWSSPPCLEVGSVWCLDHRDEPQVPPIAAKILAAGPQDPDPDLLDWLVQWARDHRTDPRFVSLTMILDGVRRQAEAGTLATPSSWQELWDVFELRGQEVAREIERLSRVRDAGELVRGRVHKPKPGGFLVELDTGFMAMASARGMSHDAIGQTLDFAVFKIEEATQRAYLSRPWAEIAFQRGRRWLSIFVNLRPGQRHQGTVRGIEPFGVLVDLGGFVGLIPDEPQSQLKELMSQAPLEVGDSVEVLVTWADKNSLLAFFSCDLPPPPDTGEPTS